MSFTGSNFVGRKIMNASSETNLKKVHLELGGKSPVIVCPDVDIKETAQIAFDAIMCNMGQVCDAGSRLYIHETIYEEFINAMLECSKNVKIGNAFDGDHVNHGPLVNKR